MFTRLNCSILAIGGSPVASKITITATYTAQFGVPSVGTRVFVQCNACIDGFQGTRMTYSALVPEQT